MDIALVAVLLGSAFAWLRQTRPRWALSGIAILGGGYLLARQLDLTLTTWILQGSIVVFVIVLVVAFQVTPDLVTHPDGFQVHGVNPEKIRLSVVRRDGS